MSADIKINILLLHEARFDVGLRRPLHMREARFICIMDSSLYHLLPIGNNFSIDKFTIKDYKVQISCTIGL